MCPSGPGVTSGKLIGIGTVRDYTHGLKFGSQQEVKFGADFTEVVMPDGDFLNSYWGFPNGFTGSVGFHDISPKLIGTALGGTVTPGEGRDEEVEAITVPSASPYEVLLGNGANILSYGIVDEDVVLLTAAGGEIRMKVVAAAPTASGEVQLIIVPGVSAKLVFNEADKGLVGVAAYPISNTTGYKIVPSPNSIPGAFHFYAALGLYLNDQALGRVVIDCSQAVWTGRFEIGETRLAHEAIIRPIRFNNRYDGALTVYTSK